MNRLLACTPEDHFVVGGLNDRIVGGQFDCQNSLVELVRSQRGQQQQQTEEEKDSNYINPDESSQKHDENAKSPSTKKEKKKQQQQKSQAAELALLNKCQSVAIHTSSSSDDVVYYAVSRGDKTLSIYQHDKGVSSSNNKSAENTDSSDSVTRLEPILTYNTPKRVGCMSFVTLDHGNLIDNDAVVLLVTGDMAGDSYAYGIIQQQTDDSSSDKADKIPCQQRHLLGHTASTLTGVICCTTSSSKSSSSSNTTQQQHQPTSNTPSTPRRLLLTCDRDEKIRVSTFPETYNICGYLLGHEEYITSMAIVPGSSPKFFDSGFKETIKYAISCSSDQTLRLWDLESLQQTAVCELVQQEQESTTTEETQTQFVPTTLAVSGDGQLVAVIYDQSRQLDVFQLSDDSGMDISFLQRIQCPSLPLGISFQKDVLVVLLQAPHVLTEYVIHKESTAGDDSTRIVEQTTPRLGIRALRDMVDKQSLTLPATILEKDKRGHPTLQKTDETRGPSGFDAPWNRVERVDTARERNRRNKKRRAERNPRTPASSTPTMAS